jgi:D-alanyl-D-alanine carboxypeptidase
MNKPFLSAMIAVAMILGAANAALSQEGPGQSDARIAASIDRAIGQSIRSREPGGAIIVVKEGQVLFRKAYGMASLELGVEMEPEMVFGIGSLTKQFAAVLTVLLAEQGRLSLTDPLAKFIPDFPAGDRITIRHLLTHTSGIKDYIPLRDFSSRMREDLSNDDVLAIVKKEPLDFPPGERSAYSNSNYALVGAVIEKVTGGSIEQAFGESLLQPLGLAHTHWLDNTKVIPGLAEGYEAVDGEIRKAALMSYSYLHAAGGLGSNVDDLAKWNDALFAGRIISRASLDECLTPQKLNNGESSDKGMGWFVDTLLGRTYVYHGGGIYGFVNHTLFLPEEEIYVAVLRNLVDRSTNTRRLAEDIAGIVLGEYTPSRAISLSQDQMSRYVGTYKFDDGSARQVMLLDERLYYGIDTSRKVQIFPESPSEFLQPGGRVRLEFRFDDEGNVVSLVITAGERSKTGIKQVPLET